MTGDELKRIRRRLKFTQVQFAEHIGVTSNTVARWERNEVTITEPMAKLIRLTTQKGKRGSKDA
jgi:DNA-binding transcriptional regulator YiaG